MSNEKSQPKLKLKDKKTLGKIFDLFLVIVILLSIAAFIFGLTFSASNSSWRITVLSISITILAIGSATFLFSSAIRINISLAFLSAAVTLFFINLGIEINDYFNYYFKITSEADKQIIKSLTWEQEKRQKLRIITNLRSRGIEAFPAPLTPTYHYFGSIFQGNHLMPDHVETDSIITLGGISKVTNVFCKGEEGFSIYESDRYGFNNDDSIYDKPGKKIILLGDSYGHGYCVMPGEDVGSVLRNRGYSTINLSISGNGPLRELATLREYGTHLDPKIILWLYFDGNDSTNLKDEIKVPILKNYLNGNYSQGLIEKQKKINQFWKKTINKAMKQKVIEIKQEDLMMAKKDNAFVRFVQAAPLERSLKYLFTFYHIRNIVKLSIADAYLGDLRNVLSRAKKDSENLGAKLYFIYLSGGEFLFRTLAPRGHQQIIEILHELGIPLIDFYDILKSQKDPSNFIADHFNAEGYKLLADTIEDKILKEVWTEN